MNRMDKKKEPLNKFSNASLLIKDRPFLYKEAYKQLRTNLSFVLQDDKVVVVTSAIPEEGKTSVAINLAITLAEAGTKVLLIDCDLRNPCIHRRLRMQKTESGGLSELLSGRAKVSEVVQTYAKGGFSVLPAGSVPPNPAELLGSRRMKLLIDGMRKYYDCIICDAPPVTVVTDAAVVSQHCDGSILVVRQDFASRDDVRAAKQSLSVVGSKVLGVIFNQYDAYQDAAKRKSRYGYYGYYGYGQRVKESK